MTDHPTAVTVTGRIVRRGALTPGRIVVAGDTIVSVTPAPAPGDDIVVPGFVDLHCHGGGGRTFTDGDPAAARAVADLHRRHGTTTLVASLVSAPLDRLRAAVTAYRPLVEEGVLAGVHLEGPYLAPARRGAHAPAHLRPVAPGELADLVAAGPVRMVTLAPDLPDATVAIRQLADAGVVAAVGHTDATYAQTHAAVAAGARVATHLFNAMRPPHHREPGPVVALLDSPDVVCELVADGVHLHPAMLTLAARTAGADRVALVTDAMAAAGLGDGDYRLGELAVRVTAGAAQLTTGELAGSTLTMDAALRQAVAAGITLPDACAMAATTPARVLGMSATVGAVEPGLRADLVVLGPDLRVRRVMRAGTWV